MKEFEQIAQKINEIAMLSLALDTLAHSGEDINWISLRAFSEDIHRLRGSFQTLVRSRKDNGNLEVAA